MAKPGGFNETTLAAYFDYLDGLRESGVTNMFGAATFLEGTFNLTRKEAREVLTGWTGTFSKEVIGNAGSHRAEGVTR